MHNLSIDRITELKLNKLLNLSGMSFSKLVNSMIDYRINELEKGIRNIEFDFNRFELKYKLKTKDFYHLYIKGEYGIESDTNDFMIWSSEYESYLKFKDELKKLR